LYTNITILIVYITLGEWFLTEGEGLQTFIDRSFKDPVAAILLKNSSLTTTQFETLIIDFLTINISENIVSFKDKALLRSKKVSRGAFSRTLSQARRNIISSMYTLLLLSYLGILDSNPFEEYRDLSQKLSEYSKLFGETNSKESRSVIARLERELMEGIKILASPRRLRAL
jgi:hypothetical protein